MKLSLFDLHCDTAGEMLKTGQELEQNELAMSLRKASVYQHYVQVMAHWTPYGVQDEDGWEYCLRMLKNLKDDPAITAKKAVIQTVCPKQVDFPTLLLAVEDARILANQLERVNLLFENGIRILTPLWKGESCIGGSHDTDKGLTDFGRAALERAVSLGMILDISHASASSAEDIFTISKKHCRPVIASHSNAYEICPVSRNLRKDQIQAIVASDGLIGINLYKNFLKPEGNATAEDALAHIDHFLEQGAKEHLALGCDMDGCNLPPDIPDVSSLHRLAELMLAHGYSECLIRAIFYGNALRFAVQYFTV
jgi:membrane dipeptidase